MVELESQVRQSKQEVDFICGEMEKERERDLDALEAEKFALKQLQEQERINSLVEQEVKIATAPLWLFKWEFPGNPLSDVIVQMRRRAFEEKVQREKQRRLERERDRVERDRELTRVKRAHEREVNNLRQQLGNGFAHAQENQK